MSKSARSILQDYGYVDGVKWLEVPFCISGVAFMIGIFNLNARSAKWETV
jgi:hypothetical protein